MPLIEFGTDLVGGEVSPAAKSSRDRRRSASVSASERMSRVSRADSYSLDVVAGVERERECGTEGRTEDLGDDERGDGGRGRSRRRCRWKIRAMVTAGLAKLVDDVNQ